MFDVRTLDVKKVTYVPVNTVGTKFRQMQLIDMSKVYVPPMNTNPSRKKGLNLMNIQKLTISLRHGIDYSRMPPVVYKKSQIINGVHYEYVLVAGWHRFQALENCEYGQWIFCVYDFAQDGYSFEDSILKFGLVENDHQSPHLESSEEDVVNVIRLLIEHNSKLVDNTEQSIRNYVDEVCMYKHWQTRAKIVRNVIRACGTSQNIVTYTAKDAFKWIGNNTDYTVAGKLDSKRKMYGWTVLEGYESEYIMNSIKHYNQSKIPSYFVCHTKPPTEKNDLTEKRNNIQKTFQEWEEALIETFNYFQKTGKFPWNVEGFLPQDHKNKESDFIALK